ncbi:MAG TPA: ammonia channel protein [Rhodospirillaceae bacterium]|nr:ammonia channel protein [Rhodospirillaceae bacterium]
MFPEICWRRVAASAAALVVLVLPSVASAADAKLSGANTAWILTATALVLFMTLPGLALFYGGLVRANNLLSVLMHCFAIACLMSVLWLVGVYSLAFGDGGGLNAYIGGLGKAFFSGVSASTLSGDIPESVFFMFQMTFAIITPALIVGAFVERIKFSAVLLICAIWIVVVYAPVCHWIWGGGWLAEKNVMDFAGGLVVHATAGISALVIAHLLGTRKGYPSELSPPHRPGMTMMGASMLWVGWFGFNAGSALAADTSAGMAMLVTHISAATASLTWMTIEWIKFGKPSLVGIVTGMNAGLATITPASGFVGPIGALVYGVLAGGVCYYGVNFVKQRLRIDDSLDVFAVHGVGGMLGILLVSVFASPDLGGMGYAEGMTMGSQFVVQLTGTVATVVWSAIATFVIVKIVTGLVGLRADEEAETDGLDLVEHGERGYN